LEVDVGVPVIPMIHHPAPVHDAAREHPPPFSAKRNINRASAFLGRFECKLICYIVLLFFPILSKNAEVANFSVAQVCPKGPQTGIG